MTRQAFPVLDTQHLRETKEALHAYSAVIGAWLKSCRPRRKHWWHASLRPSLSGLTSGIISGEVEVEIELNLRESLLQAKSIHGDLLSEPLHGQAATELAQCIEQFMINSGVNADLIPDHTEFRNLPHSGYSVEQAGKMGHAFNIVSAAMKLFRADVSEETSPIQVWPHHFDLSMLWLPGEKIEGQDPANEEYSDKQMNFGFTFGDDGIAEPYFYVTAYPIPDEMSLLKLPEPARWHSIEFSGVVLLYRDLVEISNPEAYLINLWSIMLNTGKEQMLKNKKSPL